jgi:hypothetical protein
MPRSGRLPAQSGIECDKNGAVATTAAAARDTLAQNETHELPSMRITLSCANRVL